MSYDDPDRDTRGGKASCMVVALPAIALLAAIIMALLGAPANAAPRPQAAQASRLGEVCHGYEWQRDIRMYTPEGKPTAYWLSIYLRADGGRAGILAWDDLSGRRKRYMFAKAVKITGPDTTVAKTGAYYATACATFPIADAVHKLYGSASKRKGAHKIASVTYRGTLG